MCVSSPPALMNTSRCFGLSAPWPCALVRLFLGFLLGLLTVLTLAELLCCSEPSAVLSSPAWALKWMWVTLNDHKIGAGSAGCW